jgi:hypothetical protein
LIETGSCDAPEFACIHQESFNDLAFEPYSRMQGYETRILDVSEIDLGVEEPREEEFYVVSRTVNIARP